MTDRQDRALSARDGRYFAISKFNTGLATMVKSEKLSKPRATVSFGLPSGPALMLNLARRAFHQTKDADPASMFVEWHGALVPINHSALFDYFEQFTAHIVFAFTALEAFVNEAIPKDYVYAKTKDDGQLQNLGKPEIERSINLDDKLDRVLPAALNVRSPKGTKLWERYRLVKRMRDRIIHLKTADYSPVGPETESVWGMMLRSHGEPFCDHAHAVMGHYVPATDRRWFHEYPFGVVEIDGEGTNDDPDRYGSP